MKPFTKGGVLLHGGRMRCFTPDYHSPTCSLRLRGSTIEYSAGRGGTAQISTRRNQQMQIKTVFLPIYFQKASPAQSWTLLSESVNRYLTGLRRLHFWVAPLTFLSTPKSSDDSCCLTSTGGKKQIHSQKDVTRTCALRTHAWSMRR